MYVLTNKTYLLIRPLSQIFWLLLVIKLGGIKEALNKIACCELIVKILKEMFCVMIRVLRDFDYDSRLIYRGRHTVFTFGMNLGNSQKLEPERYEIHFFSIDLLLIVEIIGDHC